MAFSGLILPLISLLAGHPHENFENIFRELVL